MTLTYRATIIFEIINGNGNPKTDAILEIPHRMPQDEFDKIMAIQRQFYPQRTAKPGPGIFVDERA